MNSSLFYSEVDSKRFGKNIHRGVIHSIDLEKLKEYIKINGVELLILRVPVTLSETIYKLNVLSQSVILADTLVYYHADLTQDFPKKLKNEIGFVQVDLQNGKVVQDIIPQIFANYTNHYSSNPSLDRKLITQGYIEWATGYVRQKDETKMAWVVYKEDVPIGFATCSQNPQIKECEGVLYGVLPDFTGGGIYSDIIRFTQNYFHENGFQKMKVSTQIQNFAVQKVWSREGFSLKEAFYTFHITCNDSV